jgi:peptidoglycan hydrolase-like protein with peptidoglycan-binding domain
VGSGRCANAWSDGARPVRLCGIGACLLALALVLGAATGGVALAQNAAEVAFWNRVRDSNNASELRAYLEAYPNGAFADTARARLKQLGPSSAQPQMPSAPGRALTDAGVVREVQEKLYNLNYDISVLNGQMNEETRTAIREWQTTAKREATGEMSDDDLTELRAARIPTTWGALAYAAKGASAVVWNRPSRQEAASAALTDCHSNSGRDSCKVVTAAESGCGALGFYTGTVRRTTYWAAYPAIRPTLGQAVDQALTWCRQNAKRPEACGIRLTFCADGSHK